MLEHVWSEYLASAVTNVALPNPEWFDAHDRRMLSGVDIVWAKTAYTAEIFRSLGCRVRHVGFTSEDRYDPQVTRESTFFHLAGKSSMKGTDRLLRVWARHPEWPRLTLVQHEADTNAPEIVAANIDRRIGYIDDHELRRLQNASEFHLCLSLTEGWGHYIVEALGIGAITVTVDAAPMNELVTNDRGALVRYKHVGSQRLATTYYFDEDHLEATIAGLLALTDAQRARLSQNSRRWFLKNQEAFPQRLNDALLELLESDAAKQATGRVAEA
jgi:glycosyltransferase involved in cell wall biosynthesis